MRNGSEKKFFEYTIEVTAAHIDGLNHVNNVVYVQWMQDAAARHWNSVSPAAAEDEVSWMVRRHEIEYLNQSYLGDVLRVKTWTGEYSAVTWNWHYEIVRASDGKKIISARSVWILLDKTTGRPRRIDHNILARFDEEELK